MNQLKNFLKHAALTLGLTVAAAGCQNWETNLEKKLVDKGFTEEQAEVGAAVGLRRVFTEKVEKDDGTVTYKLNYDGIEDKEVLQVISEMHDDIKWLLDFGGRDISFLKYLQNTGRGEHLRKQEKIYKYYKDALLEKKLHRKFERLVGQSYGYGSYSPYGYGYGGYGFYKENGTAENGTALENEKVEHKGAGERNLPNNLPKEKNPNNPRDKIEQECDHGSGYGHGYGYGTPYSLESQFKVRGDEKYSLASIFPFNRKSLVFDTDEVKKARERGDFEDPNKKIEEILTRYEFFEKVPNPQYLIDYGEKRWLFKKRIAGLKITAYNLDNDKEKKADYIEVFRLKADGAPESRPAVKMFKPSGSDSLEVIVADRDFEGEGGYGLPDYVGRHYSIETARDLMKYSELLDFIFQKKAEEEKRQWPELKEMNKLYIAPAGTLPMTPYDCKKECWDSFLPEYKTGPGNKPNSYNVHVRRDIPETVDEEDKHRLGFQIKWIAFEYLGGSRVVEFYKPKEAFKDKKLKTAISGTNISIEDEDGQIKNYNAKAVVEDPPYRIDFDRNQYKRWELLDKDEDGKCYECRRESASTEDVIPKR